MATATLPESATTASPAASTPRRRSSPRLPETGNARTWWIMALMVGAFSFCMVMQFRQSPYELSSKPIDTIRLGDNVPGVNPAEADDLTFGTTVDRESWRHLRLTGRHSSGALIEIDLLRPQSWLAAHNAEEGAVIPVEFGRIGIVGPVKVESIDECPEIRAGPRRSVTGIYRHQLADCFQRTQGRAGKRKFRSLRDERDREEVALTQPPRKDSRGSFFVRPPEQTCQAPFEPPTQRSDSFLRDEPLDATNDSNRRERCLHGLSLVAICANVSA